MVKEPKKKRLVVPYGVFASHKDWMTVAGGESAFFATKKSALAHLIKERIVNKQTRLFLFYWGFTPETGTKNWKEIPKDEYIRQGVSSES